MNEEFHFFAPTGEALQGTAESVPAACGVMFTTESRDYDFDGGGSKMFWDGSKTETIEGVPLFTDYDGVDWLKHHLIEGMGFEGDERPDSLSEATIALMREEVRIGRALEAAKALGLAMHQIAPTNPVRAYFDAAAAEVDLRAAYQHARQAAALSVACDHASSLKEALTA